MSLRRLPLSRVWPHVLAFAVPWDKPTESHFIVDDVIYMMSQWCNEHATDEWAISSPGVIYMPETYATAVFVRLYFASDVDAVMAKIVHHDKPVLTPYTFF